MNKLQRSWLLLKSSLAVIARNKQLLVFPIITFLCTIAIIGFFLLPPIFRPTGHSYTSSQHWQAIGHSLFVQSNSADGIHHKEAGAFTPAAMAYFVLLYFLAMFIGTFCNVAFFHEILAALTGQPVSIVRGLNFARSRLLPILMWTLFAGLVGLIIKAIEEKLPLLGRIVAKLIGIAWSVAAVFVIPVMVREEASANPIKVLRKSATALKRTWGEALIGYLGFSFASTIFFVISVVWLVGMIVVAVALGTYWVIAVAGVAWLIFIFTGSYLLSVASQVYRGALYLYAAEGIVSHPYDQQMLDMAWKFKKS